MRPRRSSAGAPTLTIRSATLLLTTTILAACGPTAVDEPPHSPVTEDVIHGHKLGIALTLDVYRPVVQNGAGIVYLNSGSWISPMCAFLRPGPGGPELDPEACPSVNPAAMLDAGFTVFNVRHGGAPRFDVSEATDDVRRALHHIQGNAESFGIEPSRIGVWGASAGGQLAMMLGLAEEVGGPNEGPGGGSVRTVVVYMAPHSVEVTDPGMLELVPALNMPAEVQREVSSIYYVSGDDPPTLSVHGDRDAVIPIASGEAMHSALSAAGVATQFVALEGAGHGFSGRDAESALASSVE
jgi:acetyl esterase/lipase